MRYLSVCSGIEAASVAWHDLGWTPAAFSEIEPFPSAVLAHHYPHVPNVGDMTKFKEWNLGSIDLLVGGTPCQSFSVAGLRKGLDDPRGNLMLTFLAIAERERPRWIVWENVPGVLSSNGGRDFGTFLAALGELGYGWAYRVLDAQWFGVAQRRRRVFVVGCLGDQASAAAVLFESESVRRNPAPSREARQGVARNVGGGPADGSISGAVTRKWAKDSGGPAGDECYNMIAQPVAFHYNAQASQLPTDARDTSISDALTVSQQAAVAQPVAFAQNTRDEVRLMNGDGSIVGALAAEPGMKQTCYVAQPVAYGIDGEQNASEELIGTLRSHQSGGYEGARVAQPIAIQGTLIGRGDTAGPQGSGVDERGSMFTLTKTDVHAVAQPMAMAIRTANTKANGHGIAVDVTHTLDQAQGQAVAQPVAGSHWDSPANPHPTLNQSAKGSGGIAASDQELFSQRGSGLVPQPVAQPVAFKVCGGVEVDSAGKAAGKGYLGSEETAFTIAATQDQWIGQPVGTDCYNGSITGEVAATIGTPGSSVNASGPTVMQAVAPALTASNDPSRSPQSSEVTQQVTAVHSVIMQVRRLTPVECERLQGFPDNYTNIPWRKKDEAPDGPRYKALGNSMAVPCMRWIGERIQAATERQEVPR